MKHLKYILLLLGFSYLFLMFGNGTFSLTDPDEVFYAQTAREMAQRHEWLTPYLFDGLNFEKPILIYWLLRIAFLIFGDNAFAARFFPALFGMVGILLVYVVGVIGFRDRRKAFISAVVLMSAGLYVGIARTVFTDMVFSVLILGAMTSFLAAFLRQWRPGVLLFYVFAGLAVLAKGPIGLVIPLIAAVAFSFLRRNMNYWKDWAHGAGVACLLLIALPWYWLMIHQYGDVFIREFFWNDHWIRLLTAEHQGNDRWYFYPLTMIGGMFPWSVFVLASFICLGKRLREDVSGIRMFSLCWIIAVLAVFQPAHSKLVSYILPAFPALALLAGDLLTDLWRQRQVLFWRFSAATAVIFLLIPLGLILAVQKHAAFIPSGMVAVIMMGMFVLFAVGYLLLVLRQKRASFYFPAAFFVLMFSCMVLLHPVLENNFSTASICHYWKKGASVKGTVLCSKFLARGVRYNTGATVAVVRIGGKQFFSPHPIPFFSQAKELIDFLRSQPQTYAVLDRKDLADVSSLVVPEFLIEELSRTGNIVLVKIIPGRLK